MALLVEIVQYAYVLPKAPELLGSFTDAPKPKLTLSNWMSGKYQDSLLKNFEATLQIHTFLIRLHNQIDYSVFGKINVKEVEEGKDRYLFGSSYTKAFLGEDFIGEQKIISTVKKLAFIQRELKKRNTELICILTPGKSSFVPEKLPSSYDLSKKTRSNYDAYAELFVKEGIQHVNLVNYFSKLKPKTKYPLFTQCGVHWSGYGATVAADTLFNYMEQIKKIDIRDFYDEGGEESLIPLNTDGDIFNGMNLLFDIPYHKMYYPKLIFKDDNTKTAPNTLIIGDSYIWSWINFYNFFPKLLDQKSAFWYYAAEVGWPAEPGKPLINAYNLDLKKEIDHRDFILIQCNESKLYNFGYDIVDKLFTVLQNDSTSFKSDRAKL